MIILFLISVLINITKVVSKIFLKASKTEGYETKVFAILFSLGMVALRFTVLYRWILNYTLEYLNIDYTVSIELSIVIALVFSAFSGVNNIEED